MQPKHHQPTSNFDKTFDQIRISTIF